MHNVFNLKFSLLSITSYICYKFSHFPRISFCPGILQFLSATPGKFSAVVIPDLEMIKNEVMSVNNKAQERVTRSFLHVQDHKNVVPGLNYRNFKFGFYIQLHCGARNLIAIISKHYILNPGPLHCINDRPTSYIQAPLQKK